MLPMRWRTMSLFCSVAATTLAGGTAVAVCTRGDGDADPAAPEMPEDCELPSCASKQDMLSAMLDPERVRCSSAVARPRAPAVSACRSRDRPQKNRTPQASREDPLPSDHGVPASYRACPADKDELGRHSWTLVRRAPRRSFRASPAPPRPLPAALALTPRHQLHTVAATFPDEPSEEHKRAALDLVRSMSLLYPCWYCRAHLQAHMEEEPPTCACSVDSPRVRPQREALTPSPNPFLSVHSREAFSLWLCKHHNAVNEHNGKPTFPCSLPALDERWRVGARGCWNHAGQQRRRGRSGAQAGEGEDAGEGDE